MAHHGGMKLLEMLDGHGLELAIIGNNLQVANKKIADYIVDLFPFNGFILKRRAGSFIVGNLKRARKMKRKERSGFK